MELRQLEKIAKALGDINRLKILRDMSARGGSIQCAAIMSCTELAQPSVSHHVKILIDAGLIASQKEGRNHNYTLNVPLLATFGEDVMKMANQHN